MKHMQLCGPHSKQHKQIRSCGLRGWTTPAHQRTELLVTAPISITQSSIHAEADKSEDTSAKQLIHGCQHVETAALRLVCVVGAASQRQQLATTLTASYKEVLQKALFGSLLGVSD